ncbi:TPA: ATP/GTP-binding protein [Raoultella ornithinolytica]|uniref:AAA family ATPase n=1 Tax=Enterobacterales TaxID=91347 RepID=UPI0005E58E2F|nr:MULTISPECIES: ATP-binding protein [Enterobacterales]MBT1927060.1 ATP/GTP-binding protein [Enterobacter hormaechei subsp. hoffmannii]CNI17819.1 Predicted ATPase [Yersinia frederiksenii]ATM19542.1 ATP-binding protein [Raoultella ornithinolytica]EFL8342980.1 ATP-binding protein [Escherichia coli]MBT1931852.1 ATP/GTP-binding protein [Enterobacter hormaechei subsp. hoffmannii]
MLIEFRVKNFRSLRDEQVLSLVASKDKTLQDTHTQATGISAAPAVLRSAVVYGANASGKSNLIKALQYMRGVVTESATAMQPSQTFAVQQFRLDAVSVGQPSEFEVTFLNDGVRYQYGFAMTTQRIVSEHLLVYKSFKPQHWFTRRFDADTSKDIYDFGPGLKGPKNLWEGATRPNALFLSMAVQLNSESLRPLFDWFLNHLVIFNEQAQLSPQMSIELLKQADGRKEICNFLSSADISIADIDVETRKVPGQAIHFDLMAGKTEVRSEEMEEHKVLFHHVTEQGKAVFDIMDESNGTRNLLFLAAPVLNILNKGLTLVIDELDNSLHTLLVRELVRLFHRPEINTGGAQLIFTTHDTSLLDAPNLFRRDQVWFVEKDRDQTSTLVSLSEFSPRKNEALERGYLMGRYGGVPFLDHTLGLKH